jgi:hypothetical protein
MWIHMDWRGQNTSKLGFHTVLRIHVDPCGFHVIPHRSTRKTWGSVKTSNVRRGRTYIEREIMSKQWFVGVAGSHGERGEGRTLVSATLWTLALALSLRLALALATLFNVVIGCIPSFGIGRIPGIGIGHSPGISIGRFEYQ